MSAFHDRVREFINSKWKRPTCVLCEANEWSLSDAMNLQVDAKPSDVPWATNVTTMPVVTLTCRSCGNVEIVNLIAAGLMPPFPTPTEAKL